MNTSIFQNMLARYPVATTGDRRHLSRRDSTLLTVGFSLRKGTEHTAIKSRRDDTYNTHNLWTAAYSFCVRKMDLDFDVCK
jgi:hypothetical protein